MPDVAAADDRAAPPAGAEAPLDPHRPIIDPHLHLWDIRPRADGPQEPQRFLLDEAVRTIAESGHHVTHTVFVECSAMYRSDGPPEERSLGETEFATGIAAMAASGGYGPCRIAHRLVANVDLRLGDAVAPLLERHRASAGGRLAGVRMHTAYSAAGLFGHAAEAEAAARLADPRFVGGARVLAPMGLVLDVWCLRPQLPLLARLADAVPDLAIVLDHAGTPDLHGRDPARHAEAIREWKRAIGELARRPNIRVKLSGFGMDVSKPIPAAGGSRSSEALAARWEASIATVVDAFSPARCMFASNFPPDRAAGGYGAIWNAFKRVAARYAPAEWDALFRGTAARTYGIDDLD